MTILSDDYTVSTKRIPKSHTMLLDSYISPTKLNIKLKTHSLTCLNIPLETFGSCKGTTPSIRNDRQTLMAGSVDLISEIQQQSNDQTSAHLSISQPLIKIASSNQHLSVVQQEWRQVLKDRCHISSSLIKSTSFNDSVARLRRDRQRKSFHQSSLQTIDKITERKHHFSFSHNGSIPKFTFRDLPSNSRPSSSVDQFERRSKSPMSPFISLPEIRSLSQRSSFGNSNKISQKLPPSPSWEKSSSWSWKSVANERMKTNIPNKNIPPQIDDQSRFNLPVIIESPLQQRSSLQTINPHHQYSSSKSTNIYHSNKSFSRDSIQLPSHRFYQKRKSLTHSISNCDVLSHRLPHQRKPRYPSTPVLAHSRHKNLDQCDYHSVHLSQSPIASFDVDDNDESDSILSNSSFRSCVNSINQLSADDNTDSSSVLSESSFEDLAPSFELPQETSHATTKPSRLSLRHLCTLQ